MGNIRNNILRPSFDGSGRAELRMTLFEFLNAGGPFKAEVIVPAQGDKPEYRTVMPFKLSARGVSLKGAYAPSEKTVEKMGEKPGTAEKPQGQKPLQLDGSKPAANAKEPSAQIPEIEVPKKDQPKTEAPKPEYDYNTALAAWAADYAGEVKRRVYDDGVFRSTYKFEWVMNPVIKDGQVVGASRIWETDEYYDGPRKGEKVTYIANEAYDAGNPGPYISADKLKKMYPQFSR